MRLDESVWQSKGNRHTCNLDMQNVHTMIAGVETVIWKSEQRLKVIILESFIDALLDKHESGDGDDRNQQLHQICVSNIPTDVIYKEKELQCRTA